MGITIAISIICSVAASVVIVNRHVGRLTDEILKVIRGKE